MDPIERDAKALARTTSTKRYASISGENAFVFTWLCGNRDREGNPSDRCDIIKG